MLEITQKEALAICHGRTMSTARTAPHVSPPDIVDTLRQQIRRMETLSRADDERVISTGCRELDQLLPAGGLASGTITEWLTPAGGQGAELLSLLAARQACADGGALVIIDPDQSFYAPAAAGWGINLDNTIVLYGSGASTTHNSTNLPTLIAGGSNMGLRHGTYWRRDNTRMSNVFLSILHSMGIQQESFADSTGVLRDSIFAV